MGGGDGNEMKLIKGDSDSTYWLASPKKKQKNKLVYGVKVGNKMV